MSRDIYPEHILQPLVRYLRDDPILNEMHQLVPDGMTNPVLGPPSVIARDGVVEDYPGSPELWIFRSDKSGNPHASVEGTGTSAISLSHIRDWSRPNKGQSIIFPEIVVTYHADVSRDIATNSPVDSDAYRKIQALHHRVNRLFDATFFDRIGGWFYMGARDDGSHPLRVTDSAPGNPLNIDDVIDGDGLAVGTASFDLTVLLY